MAAKENRRADHQGEHRTAFERNRQIILRTQTICAICGKIVDFSKKSPDPWSPTVDHIIPISKGGHPSDLDNLQLAHRMCNRLKSDKLFNIKFAKENQGSEVNNDDLPQHFDWAHYRE